jgi:DNA repair exonuclease SbcCD ATPase subunit
MKDCPFIDNVIKSKLEMISDEEYNSLYSQLEDTKHTIEEIKKLEYFNGEVRTCRHGIDTIRTAYSAIPNIINKHFYKFYPQVSRYKDCDEMITYSIINLIKLNVDTVAYRNCATCIYYIHSLEKDLESVNKEIQKIESSNTESISLKTLINQNTSDLQEVQSSKAALLANFGKVKNEYITIKQAYECISTAKLFKERYINDSKELKEIQAKIDSMMEGVKQYSELSKKLADIQMQSNTLATTEIPNLNMVIEKAKHQLVLFEQYKQDYAEYNDKYEKILMLKKYTGVNGIQTIYMEIFMNQIINDANKLLSLLFKGRFTLQPFIINESEFIIPCIDDNGNVRPDISIMSDSQLSEISMIISFILLHKSSKLYNIIKLDEVDDNLDNENRLQFSLLIDQIMSILHFDQCFIISHNNELNLGNSDLVITKLEDPEQRRVLYNSGANIIADFT